jgi:hypothetical protein
MASRAATLEAAAQHIALALSPLREYVASPSVAADFLGGVLGIEAQLTDAELPVLTAMAVDAGILHDAALDIAAQRQQDQADIGLMTAKTLEIFQAIANLLGHAGELKARVETIVGSGSPPDFERRLIAYLVVEYLENSFRLSLSCLEVLGIARSRVVAAEGGSTRPYVEKTLHLDRLATIIADPFGLLEEVYRWGSASGIDIEVIFETLQDLLDVLRIPVGTVSGTGAGMPELRTYSFTLRANAGRTKLIAAVDADAIGGYALPLPFPSERWGLTLEMESGLPLGSGLTIEPPLAIELVPPQGSADGYFQLQLATRDDHVAEAPLQLLGIPAGPRIEVDDITAALGGMLVWDPSRGAARTDLETQIIFSGCRFVLDFAQSDSFIAAIFPSGAIEFDLGVGISGDRGLFLLDGAGLVQTLPLQQAFGALTLHSLTLSLSGQNGAPSVELRVSGGLTVGPLAVTVDQIGLGAIIDPTAASPNLGIFDLAVHLLPPKGIGLGVDVEGTASGGGVLYIDPGGDRYAGVVDLDLLNVAISAVGIINTKLPGGGWSMFLSLSARFVGVQLGFGFTLNGVGGLVGIHRGLDDEALGDAVRTGSLDTVVFPEDPVADAARILAAIDAIFPPAPDQYVFGPVVKFGWGTPTLIEIDVGIAIQLPEPLTISLLGALEAVLPDEAAPILELNAAFAGTLNVTEGTLKIDASLSGSKVAGFLITGDLSVRMEFFGQPSFLMAFGGFHPAFDPPASFPRLERLTISLDTGDMLQLALGGYFALTSNSIQFGAFAYFHISEAGFTAEGGTSFDALVIYRRFGFTIGLSVWVSISAGSADLLCVQLSGDLTGPNPWQLVADASFKILGIKQSIDLELSFGERETQAAVETVDVQTLLEEELARDDAWSVLSPSGEVPVIVSSDADEPAVDPAGRIQVGQRIVPLDRAIERYGDAELAGEDTFSVEVLDFAAEEVEDLDDWFGSEHYFRLDQDERLSAPSFTLMKAGVIVGGASAAAPPPRSMIYDHEIAYKDPSAETPKRTVRIAGEATLDRALATRSQSASRKEFAVRDAGFAVCDARTGRVELGSRPADFFAARGALATSAREHGLVIPAYELELLA